MIEQDNMERFKRFAVGTLAITSCGFGFVLMDNDNPDIFVRWEHLGTARHGDRVEVQLLSPLFYKPTGKVIRIIERSEEDILGVFCKTKDGGIVYPLDGNLFVSLFIPSKKIEYKGRSIPLQTGQVIAAQFEKWKSRQSLPVGRVVKIVGRQKEPGMDLNVIALTYKLALNFPAEVLTEVRSIPIPAIEQELNRRADFRGLTCFTIDSARSRDLDDALSLRQLASGLFEVGVHITDVSHFVRKGSAIDREAWQRATSVYLVRKVLPMLPEPLTHDLCSLKPQCDRLTISVLIKLDSRGAVHDVQIKEAVIRSRRQLSYEEVERLLQGEGHDPLAPALQLLNLISQVLRFNRKEKGSIDLEFAKPLIVLDEEGIPRDILPLERLEAHRLVEEFMLLANREVASLIVACEQKKKQPLPFIYRVHPQPQYKHVHDLVNLLNSLGIPYKVEGKVKPEDLRNILAFIENFEFKDFIERVALNLLTRSYYSVTNIGHFALALGAYTHFTSPLRRYPDLEVHRLLKQYLPLLSQSEPANWDRYVYTELNKQLAETCAHSTKMEEVATKAEREYFKIKSLEFLAGKIGNVYEGIITGVTPFGLFVELSRYLVEGLVSLSSLDGERFHYNEKRYQLKGEQSGRTFRLGDRLAVRVAHVSVPERKASFSLA